MIPMTSVRRDPSSAEKRTSTDARTLISNEMRETLVDNMRAEFPS
ncbi:hypothetical protein OOK27_10805 [Streptomyces canus]|nr:hypothetical protein [Streptomyces canus]MCX5254668.1 hypothetical protein [Streptomyces canus]